MYGVCRRGNASISTILRTATSTPRLSSVRSSIFCLSVQGKATPDFEARWLHISSKLRSEAVAEKYNRERPDINVTKFHELVDNDLVHPNVVNEILGGMGHINLTEVQRMTINEALQGHDIVAQARTGTGKTLGFLIPTVQNILRKNPELAEPRQYGKVRASDIRAIIISPTRELAEQIGVEARKICKGTGLRVQVAVGGMNKSQMLQKTRREGCHLLVATPGRLSDLLSDEFSGVDAPNLTTFVLDEADRLLDTGFSDEIEEIMKMLPNRKDVDRQTLMFSATMPQEVMHLVRRTLKPNFHFVQTVKAGDIATHDKVPQKVVITKGLENYLPTLLELCKRELAQNRRDEAAGIDFKPFKAMVYFQMTAEVELNYRIFSELRSVGDGSRFGRHPLWPAPVTVMHGQLSQNQRTRVSEQFRRAKSAILFSTDVTARGMDFPNVTHVIQIGLPPNREQYIHRLGRTGRADKGGEGWFIINEVELREARKRLRGLPISPDKTLEASQLDMTKDAQLPTSLAETLTQVADATKMVDRRSKDNVYRTQLSFCRGSSASDQVRLLNQLTRFGWGYEQPPAISQSLVQKLGLRNTEGLNISSGSRDGSRGISAGSFDEDDPFADMFGGTNDGWKSKRAGGRGGSGRSFGRSGGRSYGRGGFGGGRDNERASF